MKITTTQSINNKKTRNEVAGEVAKIEKVDVSYVRKIINGSYKPVGDRSKIKAQRIKKLYSELTAAKKRFIRTFKKEVRA